MQLKSLGFSYDWQREISTTEPDYYKWTQWIFLQLFNRGLAYQVKCPCNHIVGSLNTFLDQYCKTLNPWTCIQRFWGCQVCGIEGKGYLWLGDIAIAYCDRWVVIGLGISEVVWDWPFCLGQAEVAVNWCPALGTVLSNEEVIDGLSERGSHPVIRKVCSLIKIWPISSCRLDMDRLFNSSISWGFYKGRFSSFFALHPHSINLIKHWRPVVSCLGVQEEICYLNSWCFSERMVHGNSLSSKILDSGMWKAESENIWALCLIMP